jgi:hypothetical protein
MSTFAVITWYSDHDYSTRCSKHPHVSLYASALPYLGGVQTVVAPNAGIQLPST